MRQASTSHDRLLHLELGRRALERGWISFDTLCRLLESLSHAKASVNDLWQHSGLLSGDELDTLLAEIPANLHSDGPETLDSGENPRPQTAPEHGHLHSSDITLLPQASSPHHGRDMDELGAIRQMVRDAPSRYVIQAEVGHGGSARVFSAYDRAMRRVVAMKVLREGYDDNRAMRFVREARATGALEHPNIIPIYDAGFLATGQPFYTMKMLRQHTLRQVLQQLARQNDDTRRAFPLERLLGIMLPICQAVGYAHAQRRVHRDLKPDNIILGDFGEVLVTDWGLARNLDEAPETFAGEQPGTLGTPAYMPPEQALGDLHLVDERADIFSLGAILYEILALCPPYEGEDVTDILQQAALARFQSPRERCPGRHIPDAVEAICSRAMAPNRQDRYPTALALHDDIQAFLSGHQQREAARKLHIAQMAQRDYFHAIEALNITQQEVRRLTKEIPPWQSPENKSPLWRAEDARERERSTMAQAFSDAVYAFTQSLVLDPNCDEAREGLATLYWSRFEQAERRGDPIDTIHFASLLRQVDIHKRYEAALDGRGTITLATTPANVNISLARIKESQRRWQTWGHQPLGPAPLHLEGLEIGPYLATIEADGYESIRYPMHIARHRGWHGQVRLCPLGTTPPGFIYIPGGPCIIGGDPDATDPIPQERLHIPSFLIAKFPVTFGEYLRFLDHLQSFDPPLARRRAPQAREADGMLVELRGERWFPKDILIEGEARRLYPHHQGHELNLPVMSVDVEDCLAYIAWRSAMDQRPYRLPTAHEWEKAARGVDGRYFPWGNHFDATFCKMRLSRPFLAQPEPVGTFQTDMSVYGVCDLAGSVQEWCRDESWRGEDIPETCRTCGGAWNKFADAARLASRMWNLSVGRSAAIGFRLTLDLPPGLPPESTP